MLTEGMIYHRSIIYKQHTELKKKKIEERGEKLEGSEKECQKAITDKLITHRNFS